MNHAPRRIPASWLALLGLAVLAASASAAYLARRGLTATSPGGGIGPAGPDAIATRDGGARLVERGRLIYQVHCLRCHGPQGRGDGPDAAEQSPPPRDLAAEAWRHGRSPESARSAIVDGVPGTSMSGLGRSLTGRELDALVSFVMSLTEGPHSASGVEAGAVPGPVSSGLAELLRRAGFHPEADPEGSPPLSLLGPDGEPCELRTFRGRWVLVHFWGTTCAPCLEELPGLGRLAQRLGERGPAVLAICTDETDPNVADRALGERAEGLRAFVDPTGLAVLRFDATTLPTTAIIDPDGRLIARRTGAIDWDSEPIGALFREGLGLVDAPPLP